MNEKLRHVLITIAAEAFAAFVFWFSWRQAHIKITPPAVIRNALPFYSPEPSAPNGNTIVMTQITPFPNQTDISTLPTIIATAVAPFSQNATVVLNPLAPATTTFSNNNQTLTLDLQKPLNPNKTYQVTITDPTDNGQYSWSFTTGDIAVDPKLLPAIDRVKQQMPYNDPNGQFTIYYAAQTDEYFITIHNDLRSVNDQAAALAWFRSQGITDTTSLQITWEPSDAF